jgi:hypothetical protein
LLHRGLCLAQRGLLRPHVGARDGQVGLGLRQEDGPKEIERRDTYIAGGAILQLELTTRLTITARAGITNIFGSTVSDIGVGLSIY